MKEFEHNLPYSDDNQDKVSGIKIHYIIILLFTVGFILLMLTYGYIHNKISKLETKNLVKYYNSSIQKNVSRWFSNADNSLNSVVSVLSYFLQDNSNVSKEKISDFLSTYHGKSKQIDAIYFFKHNGKQDIDMANLSSLVSFSFKDIYINEQKWLGFNNWIREATNKDSSFYCGIFDSSVNSSNRSSIILLAQKVLVDDYPIGVVFMELNTNSLLNYIKTDKISIDSEIYVVNNQGRLITDNKTLLSKKDAIVAKEEQFLYEDLTKDYIKRSTINNYYIIRSNIENSSWMVVSVGKDNELTNVFTKFWQYLIGLCLFIYLIVVFSAILFLSQPFKDFILTLKNSSKNGVLEIGDTDYDIYEINILSYYLKALNYKLNLFLLSIQQYIISYDNKAKKIKVFLSSVKDALNSLGKSSAILHQEFKKNEEIKSISNNVPAIISEKVNSLNSGLQEQLEGVYKNLHIFNVFMRDSFNSQQTLDNANDILNLLSNNYNYGKKLLDESQDQVRTIISYSSAINESNQVVTDMITRCNLLAMNAVIEAFHMGDAGRGFVTLAGEIRLILFSITDYLKNNENNFLQTQDTIHNYMVSNQRISESVSDVYIKSNELHAKFKQLLELFDEKFSNSEAIFKTVKHIETISDILEDQLIGIKQLNEDNQNYLLSIKENDQKFNYNIENFYQTTSQLIKHVNENNKFDDSGITSDELLKELNKFRFKK